MIVKGSINYTPSGRKRTSLKKITKKLTAVSLPKRPAYRRETASYASNKEFIGNTEKTGEWKKEESCNFTVSIPYNKGGYQVIPSNEIKHIGKK